MHHFFQLTSNFKKHILCLPKQILFQVNPINLLQLLTLNMKYQNASFSVSQEVHLFLFLFCDVLFHIEHIFFVSLFPPSQRVYLASVILPYSLARFCISSRKLKEKILSVFLYNMNNFYENIFIKDCCYNKDVERNHSKTVNFFIF